MGPPNEFSSFNEIPRLWARKKGGQTAYIFLNDGEDEELKITYGELDAQAKAIAALLQGLGAQKERVLLLYPPGLEYINAFLGCLYAGAIAVPAYPPDPSRFQRTLPRLQAIAEDSQAKFVLTTDGIFSIAEGVFQLVPGLKKLIWKTTDKLDIKMGDLWQNPIVNYETVSMLQYTSGSMGSPKGVMISHGNLLHNEMMLKKAFRTDEKMIVMGWLPLYHDMGLIGNLLHPMYMGCPCILMSPLSFLQRPFRWLKAITRYKANTSGGPNFGYDLCVRKISPEQKAGLNLSHWSRAYCGAEPIRKETLDRFSEYFSECGFRKEAFYPCYGLAEGTLLVSAEKNGSLPRVKTIYKKLMEKKVLKETSSPGKFKQEIVGCGKAVLNQKIAVVDPETSIQCTEGQVGEIWVSGPSVAQGYWNRPHETTATFHASLKETGEGPYLRTGDLGFLDGGELFVTGRLKNMIIIDGQNHFSEDIELTVQRSHPAIRPGSCAVFSIDVQEEESLIVVQEINDALESDLEQINNAIRQAIIDYHEITVYNVVLIPPRTLSKTSSGKVQRFACRESYLAGTLEAFYTTIDGSKKNPGTTISA